MANTCIPMLKECCCGCSLKTGSMIIGFITLVWAGVLTYIAAISLLDDNYVILVHNSTLDTALEGAVLAVRVMQAAFSLLLIIATHKEHAAMILPWLVISLVVVLVEGTSLVIMLVQLAVGDINPRVTSMATHVSVTIYFFFVVFTYYREIKSRTTVARKD